MSQIISNLKPTLDIFSEAIGSDDSIPLPLTHTLTTVIDTVNKPATDFFDPVLQVDLDPDAFIEEHPLTPAIQQKALTAADFAVDWQQRFDDTTLDHLVSEGYVVLDEVFSTSAILALQTESGFIYYRDAMVADGLLVKEIRGDRIRWITNHFIAGAYYLEQINDLAQYFNRTLYAGIRHSEAHYACYPPGFGYQWHTDNPNGRNERVISAVFYLNDAWTEADGGALAVVDNAGNEQHILPKANRLVVFDSDLRHQVEIAHRQRYSIATWLRRDDAVALVR